MGRAPAGAAVERPALRFWIFVPGVGFGLAPGVWIWGLGLGV